MLKGTPVSIVHDAVEQGFRWDGADALFAKDGLEYGRERTGPGAPAAHGGGGCRWPT